MMEFNFDPFRAITERDWVDISGLEGYHGIEALYFRNLEYFNELENEAEKEAESDPISVDIVDHYME